MKISVKNTVLVIQAVLASLYITAIGCALDSIPTGSWAGCANRYLADCGR